MTYYLIQRFHATTSSPLSRKGLDAAFVFEYMGSAEFEFNTLPHTVRLMRKNEEKYSIHQITHGKFGAFVYSQPEELERAKQLFEHELQGRHDIDFKEPTHLFWAYHPQNRNVPTAAWITVQVKGGHYEWAPFALFMKKKDANTWRKHIRNPPKD